MSTLSVNIASIREVKPHPDAQRLVICVIEGWNCITSIKDNLKAGDLVVYFPIDSLLPKELEDRIFGPEAKIRLNGKKVKTIRIRGEYSQGLAVPLSKFPEFANERVGADLTERLGVKKWEPKEDGYKGANLKGRQASKKELNPHFYKYTDLQHLRKHHDWFLPEDVVVATEKLHGTSARYACLPHDINAFTPWWKKALYAIGLLNKFQFCYGSRNVQLQTRWMKWNFVFKKLPTDVYTKILKQEKLKKKIKPNEAVYGEIVGHGVQKNYHYGHWNGQYSFYVYDVQVNGKWLNHEEIQQYCRERSLKVVPELFRGRFDMDELLKLTRGPSTICDPDLQPIREGIVIRTITESLAPSGSRKMTKWVSEEFLVRNDEDEGTDFH